LTALAGLHVRGADIDWTSFYPGGTHIDLPTYPFERHPYWPAVSTTPDVRTAGLDSIGHPLLGAAVELADGEGYLFTSRLSVRTHPWLADHSLHGRVLLPGAALVELVLRAGDEVGCERVDELMMTAPLVVDGAIQLQLRVGTADAAGRRPVAVHTRPEDADDRPWTEHATGYLAAGPATEDFDATVWPPAGAERVDIEGCYDSFADLGFAYGPVFRGLRAVWRRGDEVFAEVALPDGVEPGAFGIHPALLDAALHAVAFARQHTEGAVPFSWEGVSLHATGATALRVRLTTTGGSAMSVALADAAGVPVASVDSLLTQAVSARQLDATTDSLFCLDWVRVAVPDLAGADVVVEHCVGEGGVVGSAHALAVRVLALV
ncbi:polyketide synthase dehydratase domain-containing protein, partial [Streptomyces pacificus]|uniref:polyketide synthase dehydratase domain-containing protein n=1 Tax=Streptomyces pacificus TaxID=2705029 RepID=UPI001566A6FF